MSADRLREAARVLRERAEPCFLPPWEVEEEVHSDLGGQDTYWHVVDHDGIEHVAQVDRYEDCSYIATMHPGVGLALADWLEKAATEWEVWGEHDRNIDQPLVVADLILG